MNIHKTRHLILSGLVLVGTLTSLTDHAVAACYVDQFVPGKVTCETSKSISADFSLGCDATPDRFVQVEVECPRFNRDTDNTSGDYYDGVDKSESTW